jgi:hypothetical protein
MIPIVRRTFLRVTILIVALVVVVGSAWAVTPMHPYRIGPTRACLIQNGARLSPASTSTYPGGIVWTLPSYAQTASDIDLYFLANPGRAAIVETTLEKAAHDMGLTNSQVERFVMRRGNVVFKPLYMSDLTPARVATIVDCLRS